MNLPKSTASAGVCVAVLLSTLLGGAASFAQDLRHPREMDLPPSQFQRPGPESLQLTLDNGVVAYVVEDHRAPLVTLTAFVGVGSGHGAPGEAAALAAAFRRGPQSMAGTDFVDSLAAMHAQFHVTQHHEITEVFLDVPVKDSAKALNLLGELLSNPAFDGTGSGPRQATASGSIDYNYSLVNALALFNDRLFAGHPFTRTASSQEQTLAAQSGARKLHERYVVAKNVTLAVAGDFERSTAIKDTRRAFRALRNEQPPAPKSFPALFTNDGPDDGSKNSRQLITQQADRIQGWIVIGHELPVVPTEDEAALAVMDYVLGAYHLDSRLYRSSRELRGLTNDNSSFLEPGVRGPGSYTFRTYGRPEAVRLLVKITFDELNRMRDTLPTDTELFVAKGALVDGIYAERYATGVNASQAYAKEWLTLGSHERSASFADRVAQVTPESVRQAAIKYIHPERMIVTVLGPLEKIEAAPPIESEPQIAVWGATSRP